MNILLVDDADNIFPYIKGVITEIYSDWHIDFANSYKMAISMLQSTIYDLFILDYELEPDNPQNNGLALGLEIKSRKEYNYTPIIFETSFSEYVYDAMNKLNCIYYLVKPYTRDQLLQMIDKIANIPVTKRGVLLHDIAGIDFYVYFDEILYIESLGHQLTINTLDECILLNRYSFKDFSEKKLFKCHKSYMVNINYVTSYDSGLSTFSLRNPKNNKVTHISVGRSFKKLAEERMKQR